jgi:membrane-associated HD superfamily phosphohydrolase
MLADSTEAAVRATAMNGRLANARDTNVDRALTLEGIVDRVIQERLDDGQLSECDLTLREIELIRRTFVSILEGIYHPRIDYPELKKPAPKVALGVGRVDAAGL